MAADQSVSMRIDSLSVAGPVCASLFVRADDRASPVAVKLTFCRKSASVFGVTFTV